MKKYRDLRKRIEKDKARKAKARAKRHAEHDGLETISSWTNWIQAAQASQISASFKRSVQAFNDQSILQIRAMRKTILAGGVPNVATNRECVIRERGKRRKITPVVIEDRVMQHVLSDNGITPLLRPIVIRQSCANQLHKGTYLARLLADRYLEEAKRKWGTFYIMTFDFQNFFGSIRHDQCACVLRRLFDDERLVKLAMMIITSYQAAQLRKRLKEDPSFTSTEYSQAIADLCAWKGVGVCLGSQISQDMAIMVPDPIDKLIKARMPYYIRFADDGLIIWHSKEDLIALKHDIEEAARRIGLTLHPHKTIIRRSDQGFIFLKTRYRIVGRKTIKRIDHGSIIRMRRKLRKFGHLVQVGRMSFDDVYASLASWKSHTTHTRCTRTLKSIDMLYDKTFGGAACDTTKSDETERSSAADHPDPCGGSSPGGGSR